MRQVEHVPATEESDEPLPVGQPIVEPENEPNEPLPVGEPIVESTDDKEEERRLERRLRRCLRHRRGIRAGPTIEEDAVESFIYLET